MKRRIFIAVLAVLLWTGLLAITARALLADEASLTGNTISVGGVGLLISNSQNSSSTLFEKTREGFSFTLPPGGRAERFFLLKNVSDEGIPMTISMRTYIENQQSGALLSGTTVSVVPVDAEGNEVSGAKHAAGTISALSGGAVTLDGIIQPGKMQRYKLTVMLSAGVSTPNISQGYNLVFTGLQTI